MFKSGLRYNRVSGWMMVNCCGLCPMIGRCKTYTPRIADNSIKLYRLILQGNESINKEYINANRNIKFLEQRRVAS